MPPRRSRRLNVIHTNVSPEHIEQTKRPLSSFIGELLANAYDAAGSSASAVRSSFDDKANTIVISNPSSDQLARQHFVYKPTGKQADPSKQGIFGGGMKDAICMFKLKKLGWTAEHNRRGFRLIDTLHEDGSVQIQPFEVDEDSATTDVVMTISWNTGSDVTLEHFKSALHQAQKSNWHWLLLKGHLKIVKHFPDRGTVAKWVKGHRPKETVAFSFGMRYTLENARPLLLAVNLVTKDKKHVGGRDRLYIPDWRARTGRLVKSVMTQNGLEVKDRLVFAEYVNDSFLEEGTDWWEKGQALITDRIETVLKEREEECRRKQDELQNNLRQLRRDKEKTEAEGKAEVDDIAEEVLTGFAQQIELQQARDRVEEEVRKISAKIAVAEKEKKKLQQPRPLVAATTSVAGLADARVIYQPRGRSKLPRASEFRSASGAKITDAMTQALRKVTWLFGATTMTGAKIKFMPDGMGASRWDVHSKTLFIVTKPGKTAREYISEAVAALDLDCAEFSTHEGLVSALLNGASSNSTIDSDNEEEPPDLTRAFRPLIVIDEWGTKTGGIAAFNMQLVKDLAKRPDASVYLYASKDANKIPKMKNVAVIRHTSSPTAPNFVGCDFNVIIGHAHHKLLPKFEEIANSDQGKTCKKWLLLHTVPEDTSGTSNSDTEEAVAKADAIKTVLPLCDRVFSVGEKIHGNWDGVVTNAGCQHHVFYPMLNDRFMSSCTTKDARQILCFGRFDPSKGMDILRPTFEAVRANALSVKFVLRGPKDVEAARKQLDVDSHSFVIRTYASQVKVQQDLCTAAICLMPSFNEPFGLVGLEALAACVVPLMSRTAGLAEYLKACCKREHVDKLLVDNDGTGEERVQHWTAAVQFWLGMPGQQRIQIIKDIRNDVLAASETLDSVGKMCNIDLTSAARTASTNGK